MEVGEDVDVVLEADPDLGDRLVGVVDVGVGERQGDAVEEREEDQHQHAEQRRQDVGVGHAVLDQGGAGARGAAQPDEGEEGEREQGQGGDRAGQAAGVRAGQLAERGPRRRPGRADQAARLAVEVGVPGDGASGGSAGMPSSARSASGALRLLADLRRPPLRGRLRRSRAQLAARRSGRRRPGRPPGAGPRRATSTQRRSPGRTRGGGRRSPAPARRRGRHRRRRRLRGGSASPSAPCRSPAPPRSTGAASASSAVRPALDSARSPRPGPAPSAPWRLPSTAARSLWPRSKSGFSSSARARGAALSPWSAGAVEASSCDAVEARPRGRPPPPGGRRRSAATAWRTASPAGFRGPSGGACRGGVELGADPHPASSVLGGGRGSGAGPRPRRSPAEPPSATRRRSPGHERGEAPRG